MSQSLLDFLSERGLRDQAGELRSMDADRWHRARPGRRRLVREDGRTLDAAALAAWEAGFLGGQDRPDICTLLEAIEGELRGNPVYRPEDMAAAEAGVIHHIPDGARALHCDATGAVAYLYERAFVTRKGREGVTLYAKCYAPGARKPDLHTVFREAAERDAAINGFFATLGAPSADCPF